MVSTQRRFIFVTLFLAMFMTISSVPIVDYESVTSEPEKKFIDNEIKGTTELPDVITDKLLFYDVTAIPIGENIKTGDALLFENIDDIPHFPPTEDPRSFQMTVPVDTVVEHK